MFVQYLPLREDFEENQAVFRCLDVIYRQGNDNLIPLLGRVLIVGLQVLYKKQHNSDGKVISSAMCTGIFLEIITNSYFVFQSVAI